MKQAIVSLVSAKKNNPHCDVALITNIEIPEKFQALFLKHNVLTIQVPFDKFLFDVNLKWNLDPYKLCALDYLVNETKYEQFLLLDTDTYVQSDLTNLWTEAEQKILLLHIRSGLSSIDMQHVNETYKKLYGKSVYLTLYGGEFICGSRNMLKEFLGHCQTVYNDMIAKKISTEKGNEFLVPAAVVNCPQLIKEGGAYIDRYWTGRWYTVSTNYTRICILHLPAEKDYAIPAIYKYICKHEKLPKNKKVYKLVGLPKPKRPLYMSTFKRAIKYSRKK